MQRRKRRLTIFLAPVNDLTPCATTPPSRRKRTRARDRIERESSLVAVERRAEHRIHGKGAAARALCAGAGRGTDGGRGAAPCRKELLSPLSTLYIARAELEASPPTRCFTPRHVCTLPYEYGFTGAPEPPVKVISKVYTPRVRRVRYRGYTPIVTPPAGAVPTVCKRCTP